MSVRCALKKILTTLETAKNVNVLGISLYAIQIGLVINALKKGSARFN